MIEQAVMTKALRGGPAEEPRFRTMTKALIVTAVAIAACHPKQPPPQPLPPLVTSTGSASGSATPTTKPGTMVTGRSQRWIAIGRGGRKSGYFTMAFQPGGTIAVVHHILENGRGPHVEATIRLTPDLTIASFNSTGHHEMGTKVAESFVRSGNHVEWNSEEEHGDRTVSGPAFFMPISDLEMAPFLVPAARKAGGTIKLLPGGEATVESVGDLEVTSGTAKRKLSGYSIRGLDLSPSYAWFDERGDFFGDFSAGVSFVPEGWESVIDTVVVHQRALDAVASAKLAMLARHVPPAQGFALTHATVLDVVKGTWLADQTIVIVGDTIKGVGKTIAIPKDAEVIDLAGKRVIPGLVDMHSHTDPAGAVLDIASGVTTVRDVGNDPDQLDEMKKSFDAGTAVGPSIVRMGFIEGRGDKAASSKITAETVDEAKAAVGFFAKRGYEGIKIYNSMKVELVPVLTAEAHKRGMLVTGHIPFHMLANEAVRAGYDGVEHINQMMLNFFATHDTDTRDTTRFTLVGDKMAAFDLDGKEMRELIQLFRDHKTILTPTLTAFEDLYAGTTGKITPGLEDTVGRMPLLLQRGFLIGGLPGDAAKHDLYLKSWDKLLAAVKAMWKAKLHVVAGTDWYGGIMLHHELALLVRAGIPTAEVLRMATLDAARGMKLDGKVGSIAVGKRADLAILDGDPLADIKQLRTIERAVRAGVIYTSAPLYAAVGVQQ